MSYTNSNSYETTVDQQFEKLYPRYDYSLDSLNHEKDMRKRKRMKTVD